MEEECRVYDQSLGVPRSEFKELVGEKRARPEVEGRSDFDLKRVKMRDLQSVFLSEERTTRETVPVAHRAIDLNTNLGATCTVVVNDAMACDKEMNPFISFRNPETECDVNTLKTRGFGLDLNAEDNSSSINCESFYPLKVCRNLKPIDDSDCGSSVGPLEEKDPMKVWKEMKRNGFLSSSHGGVPMPKPRGRKSKNDGIIKRKMELAKKEQVDRFAKMAAPSGLLNDLNPGIINHVRNKKQVHSIIEALVKSEINENRHSGSKQGEQTKRGMANSSERKDLKSLDRSEIGGHSVSQETGSVIGLPESRQTNEHPASMNTSIYLYSQLTRGDDDSCMVDTRGLGNTKCFAHPNQESDDDILALKLSSSATIPLDNISSLSNEESLNLTSVTSLSIRAASVASQWLELLHQDIKGRLAALRRSKKRVRAVINTELPFLFSKEFPSVQENVSYTPNTSAAGRSHNSAGAHHAKWNLLFDQMDKTLSEEEKQMESWLNQVREMQLQCEKGLFKYNTAYALQHPSAFENDCRLQKDDSSERDLVVRAAAASIYSTCNFLLSMENLPCC